MPEKEEDIKKQPVSKEKPTGVAKPGLRGLSKLSSKEELLPTFKKSFFSFFIEVVKVVLISLAIIIPVRYFLIQPFYVRGASMEPTFYDNEYLIINEIVYRFTEPKRGDVVVMKSRANPREYLIKRIIGMPYEKVELAGGKIIISKQGELKGEVLEEKYLSNSTVTKGNQVVILKKDEYYLLGDNRNSSLDSRSFGAVPKKEIIGRVWFRAWPILKMKHFSAPEYNL